MLQKINFLINFPLPLQLTLIRTFLKIKLNSSLSPAEKELVDLFDYLLAVDGRVLQENEKEWQIIFPRRAQNPTQAVLRKNSSDTQVFRQVVVEGEYEALTDFIRRQGSASQIRYILDAGANIGLTTLHLKRHYSGAEVICLEPDADNFASLARNINLNSLLNVHPMKAGLWKVEQLLEVKSDTETGAEWTFYLEESSPENPGAIQGYSIVDLLKKHNWPHLDILKIDIEGAERYIFEDPIKSAAFLGLVRFISLEIHDQFNIRGKIMDQLEANGFECFDSGELTIGINRRF